MHHIGITVDPVTVAERKLSGVCIACGGDPYVASAGTYTCFCWFEKISSFNTSAGKEDGGNR